MLPKLREIFLMYESRDELFNILSKDKNLFVHFSDSEEEPYYRESWNTPFSAGTPYGVYVYPASTVLNNKETYAGNRKYAHILRSKADMIEFIEQSDRMDDMTKLKSLLNNEDYWKKLDRLWNKYESNYKGPRGPAKLWFFITKALPEKYRDDPEEQPGWSAPSIADPAYSSELIRKLGYGGVIDDSGIIWPSEPSQAFFVDDKSFEVIDTIEL